MNQIVCNTRFRLDPFSDGGSKRSVQIRELLTKSGIAFIEDSFILPKNASWIQLVKWTLKAMPFIRRYYPKGVIKSIRRYVELVKYFALRIPVVLDKYRDQKVTFLWENTNDQDMLYLMKATGRQVIGFPHNLESLVRSRSITALEKEVSNLRRCDVVYAISKEETWLLRILGLNAYYLPYYPPQEAESFLLSIRHERKCHNWPPQKKYALLGSATNSPTRAGMQAMIDFATTQSFLFELNVAGYGTETLKVASHRNIRMLGTLSNDSLKQLLLDIDAVIIFQPPTTGALTRIPEMLIAGIPVFANFDAARNYHECKDVMQYQSFEDLFSKLNSFTPYEADPYKHDGAAESGFVDRIKGLIV